MNSYEKLDLILEKIGDIEKRLTKLENNTDEINSKTDDMHQHVPFIDFLKGISDHVAYKLGYEGYNIKEIEN